MSEIKTVWVVVLFLIFSVLPVQAGEHLYYIPYMKDGDATKTGIGIRNLSDEKTASTTVTVYDQSGNAVSLKGSPDKTIPPKGQKAFAVLTQSPPVEGNIVISSDQPLAGLCFIQSTSTHNYLADIPFTSNLSYKLTAPHVAQSDIWDSAAHVSNPNDSSADVTLTFTDSEGTARYSETYTIPANGSGVYPFSGLLQGGVYDNGSVTITGSAPIAAFVLYDNLKTEGGYSHAGINAVNPGIEGGWVLYDDFESGTFDPAKWVLDQSSAQITIENGEAKMTHQTGFPNDSSWLEFPNPENIRAIKADLRVVNCNGDVRCRIAGTDFADSEGNFIWQNIQLRNNFGYVDFWAGGLDPEDATMQSELLYTIFKRPTTVSGVEHTLYLLFTPTSTIAGGENLGKVEFLPDQELFPASVNWLFKGIGTRSTNGDGPCTLFIDNVYVQ